jgi:hypothetical protein
MKKSNGAPHFQKKKKHQKKHFEPSWSPNARARARLKRPPEQEAAVITVTTLANEAASNSIKVKAEEKKSRPYFSRQREELILDGRRRSIDGGRGPQEEGPRGEGQRPRRAVQP